MASFFAAGKLYGLTFKERHDIPVYQRDERAARLRRVSVAGERDVGDVAGSTQELRETLQDRRTDPAGVARQSDRRAKIQSRLQNNRILVGVTSRSGVASTQSIRCSKRCGRF